MRVDIANRSDTLNRDPWSCGSLPAKSFAAIGDMPITLSLIIPTFNEALNIEAAVDHIMSELPHLVKVFELIIVDDGSTDQTGNILRDLSARYKNVIKIVTHNRNAGKGAALVTGFKHAALDWILFTDADLQIDISELPAFLRSAGEYDVVIGYRTRRNDSLMRRLFSKVYGKLIYLVLRLRARDLNCPFKLLRRAILSDCNLYSRGFLIDTELIYKIRLQGHKLNEIGVASHPRPKGKSSVRLHHFSETLKELFVLVKETMTEGMST